MKDKILIISTPTGNSTRELELMEKFSKKSEWLMCPKTGLREIDPRRKDHCVECAKKYEEQFKKKDF